MYVCVEDIGFTSCYDFFLSDAVTVATV